MALTQVRWIELEEVDSTNSYALQRLAEFDPAQITAVTAVRQVAGRGSRGRQWIAHPNSNLNLSLCFRLPMPQREPATLTQVLALAACEALPEFLAHSGVSATALAEAPVQLKWPNDILWQQRKVGGILAEVEFLAPERTLAVVLGIGINVNTPDEVLDAVHRPVWPASSLLREVKRIVLGTSDRAAVTASLPLLSVTDLGRRIAAQFVQRFGEWRALGYAQGIRSQVERCLFRGECGRIRVREQSDWGEGAADTDAVPGTLEGLGEDGSLLFRADGTDAVRSLISAEILPDVPRTTSARADA